MFVEITQEQKRRYETAVSLLNPEDRRHGTQYAYSIGCRCERCKRAYARKMKTYRVRRQLNAAKQ